MGTHRKYKKVVIYKILNIVTGHFYIGSSVDFSYRKWCHINALNKNSHHSPILQNSWNKYGMESFTFLIIEYISDVSKLIEREQYWIDELNPKFNCSRIAGSPLGVKHSLTARINMSIAHIGKKLSKESIAKRSAKVSGDNHWHTRQEVSAESRKKTSDSLCKKYKEHPEIWEATGKKLMKPVIQLTKEGQEIKIWPGAIEVERCLGIKAPNIATCCKGKVKTAGGFKWQYLKVPE